MRLLPHDKDLSWTPYAWLIYVVPFALTPFLEHRHNNAAGFALFGAGLVAFLALYFRSHWVRGRELVLVAAATLILGMAFWPISLAAGAFFIYAASMVAQFESPRWAVRGVIAMAVITVLEALILHHDIVSASWPSAVTWSLAPS